MKLTYTIQVDVHRETGPNVKKGRVSAKLIHYLLNSAFASDITHEIDVRGKANPSEWYVKDAAIWPHEGSEPEQSAVQNLRTSTGNEDQAAVDAAFASDPIRKS